MTNILIVADTDSRKGWAMNLAQSLKLYYNEANIDCIKTTSLLSVSDSIHLYDLVIVALGGGANLKAIHKIKTLLLQTKPTKRPIIITGFNGIINPHNIHGLNCRIGSDIICVNTPHDYEEFSDYLQLIEYPKDPLHLLGFIEKKSDKLISSFDEFPIYDRKLVFIVQPDVPNSLTERFYIIDRLISLAKRNPRWGVFIKSRSRVGETNITHQERFRYEHIYKCSEKVRNLHFIYGHMTHILDSLNTNDLVLSVGSTVIMQCINKGIKVGVISDFGVRVDYGTEHFIGSNLFIEIDSIDKHFDHKLQPTDEWLKKYFMESYDGMEALHQKISNLVLRQSSSNGMLPFKSSIYNDSFANYLINSYSINKFDRYVFKLYKRLDEFSIKKNIMNQ